MEIEGDVLNPDDKQRLDEWRQEHAYSFDGFREDADLPPNRWRTFGNFLFLASDFYYRCFGKRGPMPDKQP